MLYGIFDVTANSGWVSVGTDHDTAAFAVESVRRWWREAGRDGCPQARRLLVTAAAGGSNGYRTRAWKAELAALAVETGLETTVCHFPPGTSNLDKRRGHRPRIKVGKGTGRRSVFTLAGRLLAAILHYRLGLPQVAVAALFGVRLETVNKRLRDIRELLDQAGTTIQPGPRRLANLEELHDLARSTGIRSLGQDQVSVLFSGKPLLDASYLLSSAAVGRGDLFWCHRQPSHRRRRTRVQSLAQQTRHRVTRVVHEPMVQGHVGERTVAGLPSTKGMWQTGDGASA